MTLLETVIGAVALGQNRAWTAGFRLGGLVGLLIGAGTFMVVDWWAR
jgi:hypothetical protein